VLTYIETKIKAHRNPEQISGRLMLEKGIAISREAIYQNVGRDRQNGGQLYVGLRRSQRLYKKRYGKKNSRGKLKSRRDIDERPSAVDKRKEVGHWEIDTVQRYDAPGHFLTLVERKTRLKLIAEIPSLHADIVSTATISLLTNIRTHVKSITADNGKEFANHEKIAARLRADFYFAKPYHSWERGTNENTNGLIRKFSSRRRTRFPVRKHSAQEIEQILNIRSRKTLNYLTPNELFLEETGCSMVYQ
jgi:IS30 family transposase